MKEPPKGMVAFVIVWIGQMVSFLGTAMAMFALMIWIWEETHQATAMALMGFFQFAPLILMTPIAGAMVDRWDRKKAMMISDLAAGMGTVVILILFMANALVIWHLYLIGIFIGAFGSFQFPAYSSSVTLMVAKKHYGRASAMMGLTESVSLIFGPPTAAVLLAIIDISGILIIDIITFTFAVSVLLFVRIPQPPEREFQKGLRGIFKDSLFGFRYIYNRKPLLGLQLTFFMFNLIVAFGETVVNPMVLARTGDNELILGAVQSAAGVGGLAGGILMAAWGGPKRKINGLLGSMAVSAAVGAILLGVGRTALLWGAGAFIFIFFGPIAMGCSQSIWQSKVLPQYQGRVFGARALIAQVSYVFAVLMVGPMADRVFEPAMDPGGLLAPMFDSLVGSGPGAGMALMLLISGILATVAAVVAYSVHAVRNVETLIPDHDHDHDHEAGESNNTKVKKRRKIRVKKRANV